MNIETYIKDMLENNNEELIIETLNELYDLVEDSTLGSLENTIFQETFDELAMHIINKYDARPYFEDFYENYESYQNNFVFHVIDHFIDKNCEKCDCVFCNYRGQ